MRFLVVAKSKSPFPPEMALGLFDAFGAWAKKYTGNKKAEQLWGFAGLPAGGGILNVESFDELDAIMSEWPIGPFADTEVYPLVDIQTSIQHTKKAILAMTPKK
ncbi:MAG: hypothetical protein HY671_08440 [Chloroflexi bacterium]|nr:hypothetical protein [Chloroflexota bacterium]